MHKQKSIHKQYNLHNIANITSPNSHIAHTKSHPYLVEQLHDHIGALIHRALAKLETGGRNAQVGLDGERLHRQRDGLLRVGALVDRDDKITIQ